MHFVFCNEAGGLESRKTQQVTFFKRMLEGIFSRNVDDRIKQYDEKIFQN